MIDSDQPPLNLLDWEHPFAYAEPHNEWAIWLWHRTEPRTKFFVMTVRGSHSAIAAIEELNKALEAARALAGRR